MEIDEGSALEAAVQWLARVVRNTEDPGDDRDVWILTSPEWRVELLGDVVGLEDDVTMLDEWAESLARGLVLRIRDLVPYAPAYHPLKSDLPLAVNTVQIVVMEQSGPPGDVYAPVGARVGFALNVVHDGDRWTIAGLQPDWYAPQWLADLTPDEDKESKPIA